MVKFVENGYNFLLIFSSVSFDANNISDDIFPQPITGNINHIGDCSIKSLTYNEHFCSRDIFYKEPFLWNRQRLNSFAYTYCTHFEFKQA